MRFGLFGGATARHGAVSDSQLYGEFVDYVCEAEELGFKSVFLVEHHFTGMSQVSSSLSMLAYLAARTTTIRLGTAVVVLPWHNPALLAEQAATIDLLSNGRFDFGIGKGYRYNEFSGFCIPMEEAGERYQETLDFLRKAWTSGGRFSHHGRRWHFENVVIEPPPVQQPHPPLWVAAGSPDVIRDVGAQGFNLLLDQFGSPEVTGQRIAAYRDGVERGGGIYRGERVGLTRALCLAHTAREREEVIAARAKFLLGAHALAANPHVKSSLALPTTPEELRQATEANALIGPPREIVERLERLQQAGVEYVLLLDVLGSREALRTFAREVIPAFAEETPRVAAQ